MWDTVGRVLSLNDIVSMGLSCLGAKVDIRVAFKVRARASSALLEDVQRSLLQGVDKLSAENAELRARLDCVEKKDARPELRAVR